jgi:hypothetical protein
MTDHDPHQRYLFAIYKGATAKQAFKRQNKKAVDEAQLAVTYGFATRPAEDKSSLKKLADVCFPMMLVLQQSSNVTVCAMPDGPRNAGSWFPHAHGIAYVHGYESRYPLATLRWLRRFVPEVCSRVCNEPVRFHVRPFLNPTRWFSYMTKNYAHTDHFPTLSPAAFALPKAAPLSPVGKFRSTAPLSDNEVFDLAAKAWLENDYTTFQSLFVRYALDNVKNVKTRWKARAKRMAATSKIE